LKQNNANLDATDASRIRIQVKKAQYS